MKEWFELKSKLEEMGVVNVYYDDNRAQMCDEEKFLALAEGCPLNITERGCKDYPLELSFERDGLTYFFIGTVKEIMDLAGRKKAV